MGDAGGETVVAASGGWILTGFRKRLSAALTESLAFKQRGDTGHLHPLGADRDHGLQEEHEREAAARDLVLDGRLSLFDADRPKGLDQSRIAEPTPHQFGAQHIARERFPIGLTQ